MAFDPIIPVSGLAGWRFLQSSMDRQADIYGRSPQLTRNIDHFREVMSKPVTLDDFMADRQLLQVALGAYGLSEEIDKRAFVRRILEDGPLDPQGFAVRLNNPDYLDLAKNFDFFTGDVVFSDAKIEKIIDQYQTQAFENAVGEADNTMRVGLNFQRKIGDIASKDYTTSTGWFKVLASAPLREVVQAAFGLPSEFANIDIDKQVETLARKSKQMFGDESVKAMADPDVMDKMLRRYFLKVEIESGPSATTRGYAALSLLSGGTGLGGAGIANLLLSNSG